MNSVQFTAESGLCSSCGLCKNVCPSKAISYDRVKGLYIPVVDEKKCISCGICIKICPGLGMSFDYGDNQLSSIYGEYQCAYNAWSKNAQLRHVSASGGVVSTLIDIMLSLQLYDVAFCVNSYNYCNQLKTSATTENEIDDGIENTSVPKSRYLPVSHEKAIEYIKQEPDKRVIFIGTSCAIQGLRKVLRFMKKDEEQYLLLGLFCDKVFNYNIYEYFSDLFSEGKNIEAIHFKNKESGGWPGNMKFFFDNGTFRFIDRKERENSKDYFMPERCLYCIDKLNTQADISFGDNYTEQNSSVLGSNTVIIRTSNGKSAWEAVGNQIEAHAVSIEQLDNAQYLVGRLNNLYYARLKEIYLQKRFGENVVLNQGIELCADACEYEPAWKNWLEKINAGAIYCENPRALLKVKRKTKTLMNSHHPVTIIYRAYASIVRRLKTVLK